MNSNYKFCDNGNNESFNCFTNVSLLKNVEFQNNIAQFMKIESLNRMGQFDYPRI